MIRPALARFVVALAAAASGAVCLHAMADGAHGPLLGVSWYPEQWPESRWDTDLDLMQKAGIRVVRVGEYAWSSMEPSEGQYDLDWLQRAVDRAAAHGISVVLATPSDAPPAWLTTKYPDTLRIDENGRRLEHGMRRQFSYSSARYREFCRKIAAQMAGRFARNPDVVGWQIGNEFTDDSYDAEARQAFHDWLRAKYGTLDALNTRWMTRYWSQTYDTWDEIPMLAERSNPGLILDYKRFVTSEWTSFQRVQIDAIRPLAGPRQFITTNLGGLGWAIRFNRHEFSRDLDISAWDAYVGQGHLDPYRMGATHDLVRGWKHRNFWVMEMQPGFVDWAPISNSLDRNETRAMAWEAVGHGADTVLFWQWRAALNGQEQYHGVLVGADGRPAPVYDEISQVGREFAAAASALAGTTPVSEVAILHDYDSRWAIDAHKQTQRYDQVDVLLGYYKPLRDLAQSIDIVDPRDPLDGYKLVVAPGLNVISADLAAHLLDYVQGGGHLVLGPRSGMKDEFNALSTQGQPGPMALPLGARVLQFYALLDDQPVAGAWGIGSATIWAEQLEATAPDTEILMRYGIGNGWLDRQPAAVTRKLGKGTITYIGALLDPALMQAAASWMVAQAGVTRDAFPAPDGVEVCRRVAQDGREVFVLINHGKGTAEWNLRAPMGDVLTGGMTQRIRLETHGVSILSSPPGRTP
jgi:beta-galactosidase